MSIQRPSCFFNLCSSCSSCSNKRRRDCLLPPTRGRLCCRGDLTAPILLPPLARSSLHSPTPPVILWRRQPHTAASPLNPRTPLRVGIHCRIFPGSASSLLGHAVVHHPGALGRRGQRGQGTTSIGRVMYVKRLTAGSTAIAQFCCDLPSKSLCQACWAANLSRRGERSFGWPRKWPISNEKWVVHF